MILVIDDRRKFSFEHTLAKNSRDGIGKLRDFYLHNTPIDELWLDHDLGGVDTGMKVCDWLELQSVVNTQHMEIGRVYLVSANPVGCVNMLRVLKKIGYNVVALNQTEVAELLDLDAMGW